MRIVLLGAPGAGKGTQAKMLADKHQIAHVSTGDIFRNEISEGTNLGQQAKQYMDQGSLVPDDIVLDMIEPYLNPKGFVLDGFPRTLDQAKGLERMLNDANAKLERVIQIDVPKDALIQRLLLRGRSDDNEKTIEHRLDVYQKQTAPLIAHYKELGLLTTINGAQDIEDVFEDLLKAAKS